VALNFHVVTATPQQRLNNPAMKASLAMKPYEYALPDRHVTFEFHSAVKIAAQLKFSLSALGPVFKQSDIGSCPTDKHDGALGFNRATCTTP